MLNRLAGAVCLLGMVIANTLFFAREILPELRAGQPPSLASVIASRSERRFQLAVRDDDGRLIGRSFTKIDPSGAYVSISSFTILEPIWLPNGLATPKVRFDADLRYRTEDGLLEDLHMQLRGLPVTLTLRGGLVPPDSFACTWRLGSLQHGSFELDADATRALGDVLRPFPDLSGLYVGRTWQLQLLNPLTRVLPNFSSSGLLEEPELVKVTRKEPVEHGGRTIEAFVVESHNLRAWVTPEGAIVRQEIRLPVLGRLVLEDEPFDEQLYDRLRTGREPDE
jgi:hypothetical protein